jgi:hypothetical protein
MVDTVGLKRKIENCVEKIAQLERDIKLLNKNFIFVDTTR